MAKLASSSGFALDFLRRLLCARSAGNSDDPAAAPRGAATPGYVPTPETEPRSPCIVARLMGLDAMPTTPPLPLRRSRSASSAEASPRPWDAPPPSPHQPRGIRASASLREKPAYLRQESDEFLLLSFSPEGGDGHRGSDVAEELEFLLAAVAAESTARGGRGPDGARKQRRSGHCRKLLFGDEEAGYSSGRRRRMPAAPECDAQNSSPVSVLEVRDAQEEESTTTTSSSFEEVEHAEPCSATSVTADEVQNSLEQQDSRRKRHADSPSPARSSCHASSRSSDRQMRNRRVVNKAEVIAPDVIGIWQPICRLVEEDLKDMKWSVKDGASVVADMESGILDHLICEMMDELVQGSSETVHPFPLRSKRQLGGKNFQTRRANGCY
ncbi:unnamed protein product [Urochloa decumbens]|uniref:DUF3741 domain-containing protein n=1 Tax=Urochloa decumbens TaxID=240449 RepID=A0ABC8WIE8_9POAL